MDITQVLNDWGWLLIPLSPIAAWMVLTPIMRIVSSGIALVVIIWMLRSGKLTKKPAEKAAVLAEVVKEAA